MCQHRAFGTARGTGCVEDDCTVFFSRFDWIRWSGIPKRIVLLGPDTFAVATPQLAHRRNVVKVGDVAFEFVFVDDCSRAALPDGVGDFRRGLARVHWHADQARALAGKIDLDKCKPVRGDQRDTITGFDARSA